MSTRASVIVKDSHGELYFYQHSDGYPEGLGKTLKTFLNTANAKYSKSDPECLSGYLLMFCNPDGRSISMTPSMGVHGDEAYQYIIDADTLEFTTRKLKAIPVMG